MAQSSAGSGAPEAPPTALRVVIVEDRPSDAELMVIGLEAEGYAPD